MSVVLAADTNVVVRLLVADDVKQQAAVLKRLERARDRGEAVVVTPVVLAEVAWVLDSAYGYSRDDIARAIRSVVSTAPFHCPEGSEVTGALDDYTTGSANFSDYLVLSLARAAGARTLLTFDKHLLRHPACAKP